MNIDPHIFREYDIRGLAEKELTSEAAFSLGRAFGSYLSDGTVVSVGRDVRLSSPRLNESYSRGVVSTGCSVIELGEVPTPAVYYSVVRLGTGGSTVVTGSHNPVEYNGFKLARGELSLYGPEIQRLRAIVEGSQFRSGQGSADSLDILPDYIDEICGRVEIGRKLRVAVDAGNGTVGPLVERLFGRLGVEVIPLYCEPDGSFPNHLPDPTVPEYVEELRKIVIKEGVDVGIAYDGDGDRIGAIDDAGRIVWGDQLLAVYAGEILSRSPGATVIFDVKCSQSLQEHITALGGRPLMWRTGHSLIKRKLKEEKAPLAGEMSGHMFFADNYFGFDDAVFASARLVSLLSRSERPLSALIDELPRYVTTPEIRLECPDSVKFELVEKLTAFFKKNHDVIDIDGARILFGDGWGLVRASNTQPALVARFEARTDERLDEIRSTVLGELESLRSAMMGRRK
ncbi:MAG: phosphomannomutase/phosphoglucomutase [Candidatus Eisenbacteria bacterium]